MAKHTTRSDTRMCMPTCISFQGTESCYAAAILNYQTISPALKSQNSSK